jgi:hypothetical protein
MQYWRVVLASVTEWFESSRGHNLFPIILDNLLFYLLNMLTPLNNQSTKIDFKPASIKIEASYFGIENAFKIHCLRVYMFL